MTAASERPVLARPAADAPGRRNVVAVDCAGVVFGFPSADERWRRALRRRFSGFLTREGTDFTVTREGVEEGRTGAEDARFPGPFGAAVDLADRSARLPSRAGPAQAGYLLRALLPSLLEDGLVFHAAVLLDGGRGFLCCGRSGAGKSTLATLAGSRAGCEELGAVCRDAGGWSVRTLPFRRSRRARAPLAGVYLLRHAARNERRRLSPSEAAREAARHVFWPESDVPSGRRSFELLAELVEQVPVWDLGFLPEASAIAEVFAPETGGRETGRAGEAS